MEDWTEINLGNNFKTEKNNYSQKSCNNANIPAAEHFPPPHQEPAKAPPSPIESSPR